MSDDVLTRQDLSCKSPKFSNSIKILPPHVSTIRFMNVRFQKRIPFVIYAEGLALCTLQDEKRGDSELYSHQVHCTIGDKLGTGLHVLDDGPYESLTVPAVV